MCGGQCNETIIIIGTQISIPSQRRFLQTGSFMHGGHSRHVLVIHSAICNACRFKLSKPLCQCWKLYVQNSSLSNPPDLPCWLTCKQFLHGVLDLPVPHSLPFPVGVKTARVKGERVLKVLRQVARNMSRELQMWWEIVMISDSNSDLCHSSGF